MLHHLMRRLGAKGRSSKPRSQNKGLLQGFRKLRLEYLEPRIALANFYVTTTADIVAADGQTSLREAINSANGNGNSGSTIDNIFLKSGTYKIGLTAAVTEDNNASGDFDITERVRIVGISASATRVDARGLDRVFDIQALDAGDDVIFENLTIKGGLTDGAGGGIRQNQNTLGQNLDLTIKNSVISGNIAERNGGGVYHNDGLLKIENTKVLLNKALGDGAGLYGHGGGLYSRYGEITAKGSTISKNNAYGSGGGLYAYGNITLEHTTVSGNVSQQGSGGGVYCGGDSAGNGNVTLEDSTVSKNIAEGAGGGIYAYNDVDLEDSTVSGNISREGNGGGIYSYQGSVDADWSSIKNNRALGSDSDGGGIWAYGDVDLECSTVSGNVAKDIGGGIKSLYGEVYAKESKVLDNVSYNDGGGIWAYDDVTLKKSSVSGNTSQHGSGGGIYSAYGRVDVSESCVDDNTAYYDAGGIRAYYDSSSSTYDIILIKSTVSGNTASTGHSGGVYTYGEIKIFDSKVNDNFAYDHGGIFTGGGGLIEKSSVSGNTASGGGGFGGYGGGITSRGFLTVKKSTISDNFAGGFGGGINSESGGLDMSDSTVSGNFANKEGGGVFELVGTATIRKSTVHDNVATSGAGLYIGGSASLKVFQSTISENRAFIQGGGIWVNTPTVTDHHLENSTISGNTAQTGGGGGIHWAGGTGDFLHVTITDNIARDGGGVFNTGTLTVRNTIIAKNFLIAAGSGPDVNGAFTDDGGNLIGINNGSNFVAGNPNVPFGSRVGTSVSPIDPKLGPLQNNGGPTETHALLSGSKAINTALSGVGVDQRGFGRPKLGGFDIGAFEKQS